CSDLDRSSNWQLGSPLEAVSSLFAVRSCTPGLQRSVQQLARLFPNFSVALARRLLESFHILQCHFTVAMLEKCPAFQAAHRIGNPGAPDGEHLRQEFLGDVERLAVDGISGHKKPACQPLLNIVHAVAGDRLRRHLIRELAVSTQPPPEFWHFLDKHEELLGFHYQRGSGDWTHSLVASGADLVEQRESNKAFAAYGHHFDCCAVLEDIDEGKHHVQR